jgi:hypothetical protein
MVTALGIGLAKNIKITGEAASATEGATATFPAELKLIKEKACSPK